MTAPSIQKFEIEDDLASQNQGAIEVTITLSDDTRRWCYFMTPSALQACGDWINGTQIRYHCNAPYMIVVADTLTEELIEKALLDIERRGIILDCTMGMDETESAEQGAAADADKPRH